MIIILKFGKNCQKTAPVQSRMKRRDKQYYSNWQDVTLEKKETRIEQKIKTK